MLTNVEPSALKEEIVKRFEEHIEFLEDPGVNARYEGLHDF